MTADGPLTKRAKLGQGPDVERLSLLTCKFPNKPTPGCFHACRMAAQALDEEACQLFVANGPNIFASRVEHATPDTLSKAKATGQAPATRDADFAPLPCPGLTAEIQSLKLSAAPSGALCLAAVDAYGSGSVQRIDARGAGLGPVVLLTEEDDIGEAGWAGIAVNFAGEGFTAATACQFARSVTWYSGGLPQRRMGSLHQPNDITLTGIGGSDTFAIAEGPQVSLWDPRMQEQQGCYCRLIPGGAEQPLYALAADPSGNLLAAGGAESTVFFFDVRKEGQPLDRWVSCTKHEIISLQFPAARSDYIFVGGADQDIRCNLVSSKARRAIIQPETQSRSKKGGSLVLNGDARWLGIARAPGCDLIVGLTALHTAVLAHVSFD